MALQSSAEYLVYPVEVSFVEGAARLSGICGGEVIGEVMTGTDEGESCTD